MSAAEVYPTHGFGSFCSATAVGRDSSTVGEQREVNPALTQSEESFVEELLANLSEYPAYYKHMGVINRDGPAPVDLSPPAPVDHAELRRRIDWGEWVVDLRNRTAFAAGHLGGSYGFELSDSFVTYLGWLYEWGAPLNLIGEDPAQIAAARREIVRIGVDDGHGAASGHIVALAGEIPLRSYRIADFDALATELDRDDVIVLDVRRIDEFEEGHIPGAANIRCTSSTTAIRNCRPPSYRCSVAASIFDRHERRVVLIDDELSAAETLGLTG